MQIRWLPGRCDGSRLRTSDLGLAGNVSTLKTPSKRLVLPRILSIFRNAHRSVQTPRCTSRFLSMSIPLFTSTRDTDSQARTALQWLTLVSWMTCSCNNICSGLNRIDQKDDCNTSVFWKKRLVNVVRRLPIFLSRRKRIVTKRLKLGSVTKRMLFVVCLSLYRDVSVWRENGWS